MKVADKPIIKACTQLKGDLDRKLTQLETRYNTLKNEVVEVCTEQKIYYKDYEITCQNDIDDLYAYDIIDSKQKEILEDKLDLATNPERNKPYQLQVLEAKIKVLNFMRKQLQDTIDLESRKEEKLWQV